MTTSGRILAVMVAVSLFSVAGCAGVADRMAGLGVVSESVSTLDGATIVEVTPNFYTTLSGQDGQRIHINWGLGGTACHRTTWH